MADIFIRSYNDYAHKFEIKGGAIEIPSRWNKPSVIKVTEEQFEELKKCDEFNQLLDAKYQQYRLVNEIPRDQIDVMEQIAQARDDAQKARDEAERNRAEAEKAKKEIERLKRDIEENGGGTSEAESVKLAKAEADATRKELEEAKAELAKLKADKPKKKTEAE